MPADWKNFWNSYRRKEVKTEADLFFEVGKTINGEPISEAQFQLTIERIRDTLSLCPDDRLLELCCGNGLLTRQLAALVAEMEAVDFAAHLIANALQWTTQKNVRYSCDDVLVYLERLEQSRRFVPTKVLLGDALSCFEPGSLRLMLTRISNLTTGRFTFLATNVPSDELKWNFYNTPERRERYEENRLRSDTFNDGIGRWWRKEELENIAGQLNLKCIIINQPPELSTYRVDAVWQPFSGTWNQVG